MALFGAFFTHLQDVDDIEALADVAASIGLDRASAVAVLTDGRFAETVREEEAFWISRGITRVPAMVFDERYLVTGAQGVENYTRVLRQLAEERTA